jgi:hypothetical protein
MTDVMTSSRETQLLQVKVPAEIVDGIDRLAGEELLTRSAFVRRLLNSTVKAAQPAR